MSRENMQQTQPQSDQTITQPINQKQVPHDYSTMTDELECQLRPINSTTLSPLSISQRTLIQPCLVLVFECFTIHERLAAQTVCKEWQRMIRLRRVWSNDQYDFPGPYFDSDQKKFVYESRAPEPSWLCQALGGLSISLTEFLLPITFQQLTAASFNNIRHLELSRDRLRANTVRACITIEEGRTALKQLRLVSFTCMDSPNTLIPEIVFGTEPEMKLIRDANAVASSSSARPQGAIFAWCETLERFKIYSLASTHPDDDMATMRSITPSHLTLMSRVVWTNLTHYSFTHSLADFTFDSASLIGLKRLFTRQCLPSLHDLTFDIGPDEESAVQVSNILREAIAHEFTDLQQTDFDIISRQPDSLRGSPPLNLCSTSLRKIKIMDEFTLEWLNAISLCTSLAQLSIQSVFVPEVNQFNFFHTISALPVTTLDMPLFDYHGSSCSTTLTIEDLDLDARMDRILDTMNQLRRDLSHLSSLTQLHLCPLPRLKSPYEGNSWLSDMDHLPQLSSFSCLFAYERTQLEHWDVWELMKVPNKSIVGMLVALTRINTLTSLTLGSLGWKDFEEFNRLWNERIEGGVEGRPIPLQQLSLTNLMLLDGTSSSENMYRLVDQLRHFHSLTNLTIHVYFNGMTENTGYESFYYGLVECHSLRHIHLLGQAGKYHRINDHVIEYWCGKAEPVRISCIGRNPVGPLPLTYRPPLPDGSSTNFPNLDSLEFENATVDSIQLFYSLPRLRHLHWTDDPHRHGWLESWMKEKNHTVTDRPPLHLINARKSLPKIDRIKRMSITDR